MHHGVVRDPSVTTSGVSGIREDREVASTVLVDDDARDQSLLFEPADPAGQAAGPQEH